MDTVRRAARAVPVVLRGARQRAAASVGWRQAPACRAPFASLYLHQSGDIRACCQNWWLPLGNIKDQRLAEIWHGERAEVLRAAILAHDYSMGCEFCQWQEDDGAESTVFARNFDDLALSGRNPAWPAQMEFSVSNTCNLQCTMCRGEWSSSIRAQREHLPPLPKVYGDQFFDDLAEFLPHLRAAKFLGGEPFLARESLRILDMLVDMGLHPETTVTTNGTIWNDRVERILGVLEPHVVVSMDGFDAESFEAIRVGADFAEVTANLRRFVAMTKKLGASVSFTLQRNNWRSLPDLFLYAAGLGVGAHVNTLMDPEDQSLFTLDEPELAEIVRALDARSGDVAQLGARYVQQWDDQLGRLHRHLDAVGVQSPAADLVYERTRTHHRFAPVIVDDPTVDELAVEAAAWAPDAWARLEFDLDGIVIDGVDHGFGVGIDAVTVFRGLGMADIEEIVLPAENRRLLDWQEPLDRWDRTYRLGGAEVELVRLLVAPRRDAAGVGRSLVMWLGRRTELAAAKEVDLPDQVTEDAMRVLVEEWAAPGSRVHRLRIADGVLASITSGQDPIIGDLSDLEGVGPGELLADIERRVGEPLVTSVEADYDGLPVVCLSAAPLSGIEVRTVIHRPNDTISTLLMAARMTPTDPSPPVAVS